MTLEEAIQHARDKAAGMECTECGQDHQQLADWLTELHTIHTQCAEPCNKEFRHLQHDLCDLIEVSKSMAFENADVPLEHRFIWRVVYDIAVRANITLKHVKYVERRG